MLGLCYYKGEGVTQDFKEAATYLRKAAEQGHGPAQFNLGVCYAKGEGVEKSDHEAQAWFKKAAAQGVPEAQMALQHHFEQKQ